VCERRRSGCERERARKHLGEKKTKKLCVRVRVGVCVEETCNFKEPTNHSHPIGVRDVKEGVHKYICVYI